MKERPSLIAVIGYMIGILWGLYFNFSIALLYIFIAVIYLVIKRNKINKKDLDRKKANQKELLEIKSKLNILSITRYFKYFKLFLNRKSIYLIIIFSIISNLIVNFQNNSYNNLYKDGEKLQFTAIVVGNKEEKEFKDTYDIKVVSEGKYENTKLILNIKKNKNVNLEYGDKIEVNGEFIEPSTRRNYNGFDYKAYLKSLKIYGSLKVDNVKVISKDNGNKLLTFANEINLKIKENISKLIQDKYSSIFTGLILGDTSNIEEDIQDDFKIANISHVLAISGMHITYIVIGIEMMLKKLIGKAKTRIITVIVLILYMFITGFSPSVVRASIMGIFLLVSKLIHRKNDIWTSISLSLLILLVYNPFLISNVGLQLSYLGTIGIVCFNKNIYSFLRKIKIRNKKLRYKINRKLILFVDKIKEILSVTLSAQIVILPIMLFNFNVLGIYFFISNILVSLIIGPVIIIGFVCTLISFLSIKLAKLLAIFMELGIKFLVNIAEISHLPFSKIYIPTPKVWYIILYYILIIIINKIYVSFNSKNPSFTDIRIKNLIALYKYKFKQNRKKISKIIITISCILILFSVFNIFPRNLKIHFLDVGQGDCTFIVTPDNKTILIDGGGSTSNEYDVGESTLLPYILDRGYTKLDYIFISHFDQDHVGGIFTILEELKVGQVYISKQDEDSANYQKFLEVIEERKIRVKVLKQGDSLKIGKDLYFDILWPIEEPIQENILNNNAMVMKLRFEKFSMLFTGDIEEIGEKKILEVYGKKASSILKADVLKVAHHGSKTSTIQEFLESVNPRVCLIGVGKNNMFGHPANEVIERLSGSKIYRTDENGEIILEINRNGGVRIKTTLMED